MNKYIIALSVGGLMEQPEITYHNFEFIEANNEKEACDIYNKKNKCLYFYGTCLFESVDGDINKISNHLKIEEIFTLLTQEK